MKNETKIVRNLLLPMIEEEIDSTAIKIDWDTITSGFVNYEKDSKLLYVEVYKIELPNPEKILSKLDELYQLFIDELAQAHVLGKANNAITSLIEQESSMFSERVTFFKTLNSVIIKQERQRIIKELPILSDRIDFSLSESELKSAFKKKGRADLKDKFKNWDKELVPKKEKGRIFQKIDVRNNQVDESTTSYSFNEVKRKGKVISFSWFKYAVAAIIITGFFIWQPTQSTNDELFASYYNHLDTLTKDNYNLLETNILNNNERGDDYIFGDYTKAESESVLSGLKSFKERNYDKAKGILFKLNPRKRSNQILFFLALSQLNTNEPETAIANLEYLNSQPDLEFSDDIKFHLSMAYIKIGNRKESKALLKELMDNNSKYKDEAKLILKKMRWF